jgi:hypothetical protein
LCFAFPSPHFSFYIMNSLTSSIMQNIVICLNKFVKIILLLCVIPIFWETFNISLGKQLYNFMFILLICCLTIASSIQWIAKVSWQFLIVVDGVNWVVPKIKAWGYGHYQNQVHTWLSCCVGFTIILHSS